MTLPGTRLIEHVATLDPTLFSGPLGTNAAMALLDTLGCGLYGASQLWGRLLREQVEKEGSRGRATLFGSTQPIATSRAALANGTASHGFELDDIIQGALAHPGAVVIPAVLAVAEDTGASGLRVLHGITAGYEMMARVGLALGHEHNSKGFHTTGIAGPIAAAVAAGVTLGLDLDTLRSAVGVACSSASGIKAFTQGTGGMVKRMHAGRAAESGVLAVELAMRGFTGPMDGIDGKFGLLEVIGGSSALHGALTENLGKGYAVSQVWVKVYPCCGLIHSTAHAIEAMKKEAAFGTNDVKQIIVNSSRRAVEQNGDPEPKDQMTAQYSIPYCAGVAVAKNPRDPSAFDEDKLWDKDVRKVAGLTRMVIDDAMEKLYPAHFAARVQLELKDGRKMEKTIVDPHGTAADAVDLPEMEAKFRLLAGAVTDNATVETVIATVRTLHSAASVGTLSAALRRPKAPAAREKATV
jgi:2-methylcitrate dehydratase PrpD